MLPIGGMPPALYFLLTGFGFPAVLVLLQFSQLTPQLLAESHGAQFLKLPGSYSMVYLSLMIERLGITSCISSFVEYIKRLAFLNS